MADPKAKAKAAQESAADARAAAKEAAVAAAKAEARAESQSAATAGGPIVGSAAGIPSTGIAANVPLDVFSPRSSERTAARQADTSAPDLSETEQRMADSLGRGRVDTANLRDIGATATPAFVSEQRPGANRKGPGESEDNPLGDRHAALRESPDTEADAPMEFGASPVDAAAALGDRGDSLRAAAGLGGGLQGVADSLHATPESGRGGDIGKEAIAENYSWVPGALASMARGSGRDIAKEVGEAADAVTLLASFVAEEISEAISPSPSSEVIMNEDGSMTWENEDGSTSHVDTDGSMTTTKTTRTTASGQPAEEVIVLKSEPTGGTTSADESGGGVKDPGGPEDQTWKPPPGWIDGDAILPPGLRTGAAVGGAKGNDGIDWAHHRAGASNPSPEAGGGRGAPSDTEIWRRNQTNESWVGQPDKDGEASGGGGGTSQEERRAQATTPPPDDVGADGIGLGGEPGNIITDQGHNDASGIDRPGGSDTESKYPTLTVGHSRHADENDD